VRNKQKGSLPASSFRSQKIVYIVHCKFEIQVPLYGVLPVKLEYNWYALAGLGEHSQGTKKPDDVQGREDKTTESHFIAALSNNYKNRDKLYLQRDQRNNMVSAKSIPKTGDHGNS